MTEFQIALKSAVFDEFVYAHKFITSFDAKTHTLVLSGYLIFDKVLKNTPQLELGAQGFSVSANWDKKPSIKLERKFPEGLNSQRCRFSVRINALDLTHFELKMDTGNESITLANITKDNSADDVRVAKKIAELEAEIVDFPVEKSTDSSIYEQWLRRLQNFSLSVGRPIEMLVLELMLNCKFRKRHWFTRQKIQSLITQFGKDNRPDLATSLSEKCARACYPYCQTNHSYALQETQHSTLIGALPHLPKLAAILAKLDYEIFINSGTLLGIIREGKPIAHDDDFDFGLILKSTNVDDAMSEWNDLRNTLVESGQARDDKSGLVLIKMNLIEGVEIDLFPAWLNTSGNLFVYPHTFGELTRDDILPLIDDPITGCKMPRNPEKMLAVNYGEDWRVPKQFAPFKWERAKRRFREMLQIWETKYSNK